MSHAMLHGYVLAYVFWVCLSLGCFGFLLLQNTVRGRWGLPLLRTFEAGARTLPLMAVLFLPFLVYMRDIYSWARPETVAADPVLAHKAIYLNPAFFTVRAAAFFFVWILFTWLLSSWSRRQDRTGDPALEQKRVNLAAPGLVLFFLTVTFAFTDWVMSIDPHWVSTIYGVWFAAGMGLAALTFAIVLLTGSRDPQIEKLLTPNLLRDLGNLLLVLCMFWAYISLSQFLIIWSANLPEEITFYKNRTAPGWSEMGTLILIGQFFLPFLVLLATRPKKSPRSLRAIALWLLAVRLLDVYWVVMPTMRASIAPTAFDVVAFVGLGVLWIAWFRWQLASAERLPRYDARLREVADHA